MDYVIRIPANNSLELEIEDILFRPPGRPSAKPLVRYKSFRYQAESWSKARRVVAKVEHHQGELFPRVGFVVTSMTLPSRSVVRFYNKRGTAEQWIKEGKQATHWTRLSCHRFRANEVRLQLSVLSYNLGNLWRRLGLPRRIKSWSLTSLQHRLMKTGGRLVDRSPDGRGRLSYQRAWSLFREASGGQWTLHQLRHSALTHLGEDGVSAPLLMAKSRHRDLRTLSRYVRPGTKAVARLTAEHDPARRGKHPRR